MLSDRPIWRDEDDAADFVVYADALAELIDYQHTDTPLTLAITAPWGAGKTSLASLVEQRLVRWPQERGEKPHVTCWFNAWSHDDAPHLGSSLAAEIVKVTNAQRPLWRRIVRPLAFTLLTPEERSRRAFGIVLACVLFGLVFLLQSEVEGIAELLTETEQWLPQVLARWPEAAPVVLGAALVASLWGKLFAVAQTAAGFVRQPANLAARGAMETVRQQLGGLIDEATRGDRRLVIFIDDLDRSTPAHALEACETTTQLLSRRGVVTVLIGDLDGVAGVAHERYHPPGHAPGATGRAYLRKIIQTELQVPTMDRATLSRLIASERSSDAPRSAPPVPSSRAPSLPLDRLRSAWARLSAKPVKSMSIIGAAMFVMLPVAFATIPGLEHSQPVWFNVVLGGAFLGWSLGMPIALGVTAWRRWQRRRAQRDRSEVDAVIASQPEPPVTGNLQRDIEQRVRASSRGRQASPALIKHRVQHYLLHESPVHGQAQEVVERYLPHRPREAKRLVNRLRLQLAIALGRGLLQAADEPDGTHLAKWVVLTERWQPLADAVLRDETLLEQLEAASEPERRPLLARHVEGLEVEPDLLRWLDDDPRLAGCIGALTGMAPRATSPAQ